MASSSILALFFLLLVHQQAWSMSDEENGNNGQIANDGRNGNPLQSANVPHRSYGEGVEDEASGGKAMGRRKRRNRKRLGRTGRRRGNQIQHKGAGPTHGKMSIHDRIEIVQHEEGNDGIDGN